MSLLPALLCAGSARDALGPTAEQQSHQVGVRSTAVGDTEPGMDDPQPGVGQAQPAVGTGCSRGHPAAVCPGAQKFCFPKK